MAGWKISKVELNKSNGWKAFKELRSTKGIKQALRDTGAEIGKVESVYDGWDRSHAIIKTDIDTFNNLVAQGKVIPKDNSKDD